MTTSVSTLRSMETLSRAARRLGADLRGADAEFCRVVTDTRQLQPGDLFVALKGENYDGHDFLAAAAGAGAVAALVSQPQDGGLAQIVVPDTLSALQAYAHSWRQDFDLPVVAVTGSNGKTTTKQLLAAVLAARGAVLATEGNLNNHIGLPLTLARLREEHRTAVIEMGANHPGEIALLAALARPQIGVVTQAGDAHLEGFGSRAGVAHAKGELFAALGAGGIAIINADDAFAPLWTQLAGAASVIRFGLEAGADVTAVDIQPVDGGMRFTLRTPEGQSGVALPLAGRHNVCNALAAAATGVALGLSPEEIAQGLARASGISGRVVWKKTEGAARLIDDSYNANPTSLLAGLQLLSVQKGERWAVLGSMAELGSDTARLHVESGRAAKALGVERLYALGPSAPHYAEGFGVGARFFGSFEDLLAALRQDLHDGVVMLVKGSRSARMERVVAALCGPQQLQQGTH